MRLAFGTRLQLLSLIMSLVPAIASAGVINNVLLQWRDQSDKCEEGSQTDVDAMMHVAMFEAINSIAGKYTPFTVRITARPGSSMDAAAATAAHDILVKLCADQKSAWDSALKSQLALIKDSVSRENGASVGRQAAAAILAVRATSKAEGKDPFMSSATAGVYVPTIRQVGMIWARQAPWVMKKYDEVRPPAPPALKSATWLRDYNEIRNLGSKAGKVRSAEQSDIGLFWASRDVRLVLRQLIGLPGRSLVDDARFLALAEMAWADSYVAMMDGKYAYNLWRPVTAIRGAAMDGNDSTSADPAWEPMVSTPWHPEYPCGHCLSAAAVGTVIDQEFGKKMPSIVVDQEKSMLRRYETAKEYIDEVAEARIMAGVHYRFSTNAGKAMGVSIGKLAFEKYFKPVRGMGRKG